MSAGLLTASFSWVSVALASVLWAWGCSSSEPERQEQGDAGVVAEDRGIRGGEGASVVLSRSAGPATSPYVVVLGIAQDAGIPQVGAWEHPAWHDPSLRRRVSSLGLVDPASGRRWLFDATPDLRVQLAQLSGQEPALRSASNGGLSGVFLTHAHMGHYTGLLFLGHESMGAKNVPVYVMPQFEQYLRTNGPWDQLVRYQNIELQTLRANEPVELAEGLRVTPFVVPHRQEYSEVVGYRIDGPQSSVLFLPDIDSWAEWDAMGSRLEDVLMEVDVAYLDASFYGDGEIPGRDMSGFPHPFIQHTMDRLAKAPAEVRDRLREKVRFIHLNHTNPAQFEDSQARRILEAVGFQVAERGEVVTLGHQD